MTCRMKNPATGSGEAAIEERLIVLGSGEKSIRLRPFLDVDTVAAEEFLDRTSRAISTSN